VENSLNLIRCRYSAGDSASIVAVSGHQMSPLKVLFALAALALIGPQAASAQGNPGAQGGEGGPGRMQQWLVPTPAQDTLSHALLFRPPGEGPFPLAVIAHATTQNVLRRAQMPQPEYRALVVWLVARGFAVLVPERAGHGATGGKYLEDQGGCDEADYVRSGRVIADAIASAAGFMRKQSFIKPGGTVIVGHSAGGWGALALAKEDPEDVTAVIVFAAGRGGRANDFANQVCAPHTLLSAAREFGKGARVPVTWLVAANDSYFSPAFSRQLVDAFRAGGGKVDFHALPASGGEGHWLAETESGVRLVEPYLDRALRGARPAAAAR
jgi:dienelactone hydrolase